MKKDEEPSQNEEHSQNDDITRSESLDMFDANDQMFNEELKEEYQKLSRKEK